MPLRCHIRATSLVAIGTLMLAGCGSSGPATVPVHGTVTWQGQPLDNGTVVFHPVDVAADGLRRTPMAQLRPDGTFQMSTFAEGDGVMPGRYSVSIQSYTEGVVVDFIDPSKASKSRIPQRYTTPQTSGLTADVAPDADSVELQFDLVP